MAKKIPQHGTNNRYLHHKCRCDLCKRANAVYRRERYRSLMDKLIEEQGGKCLRCGSTEALEFHHRDPSTKVDRIANLIAHKGLAIVLAEVEKCDLLCAPCHDEYHSASGGWRYRLDFHG